MKTQALEHKRKNLYCIGLIVAILAIITLIYGCSNSVTKQPITTEVSLLVDVTQKQIAKPKATEIIPFFFLDSEQLNGAMFDYSEMNDVSLNKRVVYKLAAGSDGILTNQFDRKREVEKFTKSVTDLIDSLKDDTVGRSNSSLYLAMASELNRLAKSNYSCRILIVYSDLQENTPALSFYSAKGRTMLTSDTAKLKAMFLLQMPLDLLPGIEIRFVYQPTDAADDARYRLASSFFKELFESKAATVTISANL